MDRQQMITKILGYSDAEIFKGPKEDAVVNDRLEGLVSGFGHKYVDDWDTTLNGLTNSQLRKAVKAMGKWYGDE